jgi:hypothetical protein
MSVPTSAITKGGLARTTDGALYVEFASGGGVVLAASAVAASAGAVTTEETLATITVPANAMGLHGTLRVTTVWTHTNGANNKTLRVRFSGAAGTQYCNVVATTTATTVHQATISNRGAANSQVGGHTGVSAFSGSSGAVTTSAVDTTADTTIVISGQKASSGDTLTLERYMVELLLP